MRTREVAWLLALVPCAALACAGWPGTGTKAPAAVEYQQVRAERRETGAMRSGEVRTRIQRFADRYAEGMAWPLDSLAARATRLEVRRAAMDQALAYASAAYMIASDPEPGVALLDLLVFVSLVRTSLEDFWVPQVYGEAGRGVLEAARQFEEEALAGSRQVLSAEQVEQMRAWVREWRAANPDRQYVEWVRFAELASHLEEKQEQRAAGLVADVRRATAAADEALELARSLTYYLQRAPFLFDRHVVLTLLDIVTLPEMRGLFADANRISASAERLSLTFERLSDAVLEGPSPQHERLIAAADEADVRVRGLLGEVRETVVASSELAARADALMARINAGRRPDSKPFDIVEYHGAAAEFGRMSGELRALVVSLTELMASPELNEQLPSALLAAESRSEDLLEYAAILGVVAIVVSVCSSMLALLGYHYLSGRMDRRAREGEQA